MSWRQFPTTSTVVINATSIPEDGLIVLANAFLGILIVVGFYLLFALVAFAVRSPRKKNNRKRKIYKRALWMICIFNYAFSALHGIVTMFLYNGDLSSAEACNLFENFAVLILITLDGTIYFFLWMRQFIIYKTVTFRSESEKIFMHSLEWISMILILIVYIMSSGLVLSSRRFKFDSEEHVCVEETELVMQRVLYYIWVIGSVTIHVILVFMLVYPLATSMGYRKASAQRPASATNAGKLARRCLLISVYCVITDFVIMMTSQYSELYEGKRFLRETIYNANVLFNSIALTITFKGWMYMYFPWMRLRRRESSEVMTSSSFRAGSSVVVRYTAETSIGIQLVSDRTRL